MSPYHFLDYRDWISEYVNDRKNVMPNFSFSVLAEKTGLQRTYLSRVLKKEADLSSDQIYKICEFFDLSAEKTNYLLLLVELVRTQVPSRKESLLEKAEEIRKKHFETTSHLEIPQINVESPNFASYFLDPYVQLVHIFLTIPEYAKNPDQLAGVLKIEETRLSEILEKLIALDLVVRDRNQYKVLREALHLPKDSPLCKSYLVSQRSLVIGQLQNLPFQRAYSFSATFAANETARNEVQKRFLEFLNEAEQLTRDVVADNVYQIHFDLLPWK